MPSPRFLVYLAAIILIVVAAYLSDNSDLAIVVIAAFLGFVMARLDEAYMDSKSKVKIDEAKRKIVTELTTDYVTGVNMYGPLIGLTNSTPYQVLIQNVTAVFNNGFLRLNLGYSGESNHKLQQPIVNTIPFKPHTSSQWVIQFPFFMYRGNGSAPMLNAIEIVFLWECDGLTHKLEATLEGDKILMLGKCVSAQFEKQREDKHE